MSSESNTRSLTDSARTLTEADLEQVVGGAQSPRDAASGQVSNWYTALCTNEAIAKAPAPENGFVKK